MRKLGAPGICERCGARGPMWRPFIRVIFSAGAPGPEMTPIEPQAIGPILCDDCNIGSEYRRVVAGVYLEKRPDGTHDLHFYPFEMAVAQNVPPTSHNLAVLETAMRVKARELFPTIVLVDPDQEIQ